MRFHVAFAPALVSLETSYCDVGTREMQEASEAEKREERREKREERVGVMECVLGDFGR